MGTNYYAVKKRPTLHNHAIHIGKSSVGWKFLFQGYQKRELSYDNFITINSIGDWEKFLSNKEWVILDEYDNLVSTTDFFKMVEEKQNTENPDNFSDCANIEGYRFSYRDFG